MKGLTVLNLIEAVEEFGRILEAETEAEKKRKRKRALALALGLIGQGTVAAKTAAGGMPKASPGKLRRKIDVAAFQTIGPRGALRDPEAIEEGDTLYISPVDQPGTGLVTKDATRIPYAIAGEAVAAGTSRTIKATLFEKLWLTDGNPCEVCEENSVAGWIPVDEAFPSGDWEPQAHPNCKCSLEVRSVE